MLSRYHQGLSSQKLRQLSARWQEWMNSCHCFGVDQQIVRKWGTGSLNEPSCPANYANLLATFNREGKTLYDRGCPLTIIIMVVSIYDFGQVINLMMLNLPILGRYTFESQSALTRPVSIKFKILSGVFFGRRILREVLNTRDSSQRSLEIGPVLNQICQRMRKVHHLD